MGDQSLFIIENVKLGLYTYGTYWRKASGLLELARRMFLQLSRIVYSLRINVGLRVGGKQAGPESLPIDRICWSATLFRVFESAAYAVEGNGRKRRKYRDACMHPLSAYRCKKRSLNVFDSVSLQYSDPASLHYCCCYRSGDFYNAPQSWNPFLAVSIISLSLLQSLAKASLHLTNWLIKASVADERTQATQPFQIPRLKFYQHLSVFSH